MQTSYRHLLKSCNLNLTSVRLALLEVMEKHPHTDANFLFMQVQKKLSTASKQAIYNNLNTLVEYGIIREIKPKGQPSLYETRVSDNHHHLVCRNCGSVVDAECKSNAPCLSPKDNHGFCVDEAEVIFWGTCPSCQISNQLGRKI